ncbi:hypothetical protein CEXT_756831 [Caerostris extrusa]|uniref:Uncharacterized protein n=1 Tax=Caerostris extrusa TaxID=172846 RepID=A0AAV4NTR2_CAEEX|nr:hypothetical protein CEXT_756831 [Caerostris extrusa]
MLLTRCSKYRPLSATVTDKNYPAITCGDQNGLVPFPSRDLWYECVLVAFGARVGDAGNLSSLFDISTSPEKGAFVSPRQAPLCSRMVKYEMPGNLFPTPLRLSLLSPPLECEDIYDGMRVQLFSF